MQFGRVGGLGLIESLDGVFAGLDHVLTVSGYWFSNGSGSTAALLVKFRLASSPFPSWLF